jgi:head-tail adaptor
LTDDGFSTVETWANHGTPVWASKTDISDGERFRAGEVAAHITSRFQVTHSKFTAALTPKDRLVCEGRTFDIVGIKQIGRRVMLEITAAARADN